MIAFMLVLVGCASAPPVDPVVAAPDGALEAAADVAAEDATSPDDADAGAWVPDAEPGADAAPESDAGALDSDTPDAAEASVGSCPCAEEGAVEACDPPDTRWSDPAAPWLHATLIADDGERACRGGTWTTCEATEARVALRDPIGYGSCSEGSVCEHWRQGWWACRRVPTESTADGPGCTTDADCVATGRVCGVHHDPASPRHCVVPCDPSNADYPATWPRRDGAAPACEAP